MSDLVGTPKNEAHMIMEYTTKLQSRENKRRHLFKNFHVPIKGKDIRKKM